MARLATPFHKARARARARAHDWAHDWARPWALMAALALTAACATEGGQAPAPAGPPAGTSPAAQATYWREKFTANPKNADAAAAYIAALRQLGATEEGLAAALTGLAHSPGHPGLRTEYSLLLIENGRFREGAAILDALVAEGNGTWRRLNALGVAYDTLGEHGRAQRAYRQALEQADRKPVVLNNLALSRALGGDLTDAETYLREAAGTAPPNSRVLVNLAFILGLQGRFDESEEIIRAALPQQTAEASLGYLRELMSQPDRWGALQALDDRALGAPPPDS